MESKIQSQMRKGMLDFLVLGILKNGETYGAEIIDTLKKSDLIVVEWTVYPLLSRLQKDGLIHYYWVESESGHPRKYFRLTKSGDIAYEIMSENWRDIKNTISKLLHK